MRTLVVSTTIPSNQSAPFVLENIRTLLNANEKLRITLLVPFNENIDLEEVPRLDVTFFGIKSKSVATLSRISIPEFVREKRSYSPIIIFYLYFTFKIFSILIKEKFNSILVHWFFPNGFVVKIVSKITFKNKNARIYHTCLGSDLRIFQRIPKFLHRICDFTTSSDVVLCNSIFLTEKLGKIFKKTSVEFQTLGFDDSIFNSQKTNYNLRNNYLFVGRISEEKGIHVILECCRILRASSFDFRLKIVGTSNNLEHITNFISKSEFSDRVEFLGALEPQQIREVMNKCGTYLGMSTIEEGLSLAALEAMNSGLLLVTTGKGGLYELTCGGESGLIAKSSNELAEKLWIINKMDEIEFGAYISLAKNVAKKYSKSTTKRMWTRIYDF